MLFMAFLKVREGSNISERLVCRANYSFPEGLQPLNEYWPNTTDPAFPHVVATFEADSVEPILAVLADWNDHFHMTVVPTITAEEGLRVAEQMMQAGQQ